MEFDCTKPLGEYLEIYLENDMDDICQVLEKDGILYESQFKSLWSMVCKQNSSELVELFSERTARNINYSYDKVTCNFVFYDEERYSASKAIEKSIEYQKV